MKLLSAFICLGLSTMALPGVDTTAVLTFDDIPLGFEHEGMPEGFGNLQWDNLRVISGWNVSWNSGYRKGMVTPNNVIFNAYGDPAAIRSASLFNLDSAYLTAGVTEIQLQVQGLRGSKIIYADVYALNTAGPILIPFNYRGVDQIKFTTVPASQFVLDQLTVTFPGVNAGCPVELASHSQLHTAGVESGSVGVTAADGCAWHTGNTNDWVTLTSRVDQSGNGTVTYAVAANPSADARLGFISIGDETFGISQLGDPTVNAHPPVDLGLVVPSTLGHSFVLPRWGPDPLPFPPSVVADVLIDQHQDSGGGAVLPSISVNWDTNTQFVLTIAAPEGHKFLVQIPDGHQARFGGYLIWESSRGGLSPTGPVTVRFEGLEGEAPDFSESDAVLSTTHGFFGFYDITSSSFSGPFAFTSMSLTGNASPQYTGEGTESYSLHPYSLLQIGYQTFETVDPGRFVSIVPVGLVPPPEIQVVAMLPGVGALLIVRGPAGRTNLVEGSDDLVKWLPVSTNVMPATVCPACPFINVTDPAATNMPCRFYRAIELP